MNKLILSAVLVLSMVALTVNATAEEGSTTEPTTKCGEGKCGGSTGSKCGTGKCGDDKQDANSSKCGAGKCGGGK